MQNKKTYKMTGLFVIIGMAAFIGIVFNYVINKFTPNQDDLVVMYFEESIRGLSVGSPVVFKGVEVGKVENISLQANLKEGTFRTPVLILFNIEDSIDAVDSSELEERQIFDNLIAKGLRARLISANYLTGQLMIELVMDEKSPAVLHGNGKYWEIPTIYSPFAQLSKDLENVPLSGILSKLGDILDDIDENLPIIMKSIGSVSASVDENMPSIMDNIKEVAKNIGSITAKVDEVMDKKNGETTRTINNINNTLEEIAKAGRSLKNLTDYLERHPEAIIQGKEK